MSLSLDYLDKTLNADAGPPQHLVIWLHGLGADGHNFVELLPQITPPGMPVRYLLPHAPWQPVTINNHQLTRAWFDIYDLQSLNREDEVGLRRMQATMNTLIQTQIQSGILSTRIILAGFSQGGAMALFCGLRHPTRLGGILGLSTFLPLMQSPMTAYALQQHTTPISMMHGRYDPIVPLTLAQQSYHTIQTLTQHARWHDYSMGHELCATQIQDIQTWLRSVII